MYDVNACTHVEQLAHHSDQVWCVQTTATRIISASDDCSVVVCDFDNNCTWKDG